MREGEEYHMITDKLQKASREKVILNEKEVTNEREKWLLRKAW